MVSLLDLLCRCEAVEDAFRFLFFRVDPPPLREDPCSFVFVNGALVVELDGVVVVLGIPMEEEFVESGCGCVIVFLGGRKFVGKGVNAEAVVLEGTFVRFELMEVVDPPIGLTPATVP